MDPGTYILPSPIKYGREYEWCDLDAAQQNQMVQDMFANSNRMLRSVSIRFRRWKQLED